MLYNEQVRCGDNKYSIKKVNIAVVLQLLDNIQYQSLAVTY